MYNIRLFVEDNGHEVFLGALIQRFASMYNVSVDPRFGNAEGGYGKMVSELKEFIKDLLTDQLEHAEASLGHLLKALRQQFQAWQQIC